MLYKRKLISSNNYNLWRVRKELHRNCQKCISDPRSCGDYIISIYSSVDEHLFIINLKSCCKSLKNKLVYVVEEVCNI